MAVTEFPNRPIQRPHTRIYTDTSAITGAASDSDKPLMLIGSAQGGAPNTVYEVSNYVQASQIFRGGDLVEAMELAWNPSGETAGAGRILAMRVEDATNATLEKGPITFESKLYGSDANQIQIALGEEEVLGTTSKTLTVEFAPDAYSEQFRNIGTIFTLTHDGTGIGEGETGGATVTVKDNLITLTVGDTEKSFPLGTGRYNKANVLVNAINELPGFTAKMPTGSDKNIDTDRLDNVENVEITETPTPITGLVADIERQLQYNEYVGVAENGGTGSIEYFELTNLSEGKDGGVPETWYDKIAQFANEGGYYLVPLTSKQSVHAEALSFVKERNSQAEPMRTIVGAGFKETTEQLLARSAALRDSRAVLVGFSSTQPMADGRTKEIPAYMNAAKVAGLVSGLEIGESMTFSQISLNNTEPVLDGGQLDALNTGGVVMAEFVRDRTATKYRIVDDVTTYNDKSDPVLNQLAIGEANDFLVSEMKLHLDDNFIGTKARNISPSLIKSSLSSFLDQKVRDGEIQDYAAEELQVVINGEVAEITLVVFPIRSLKKINVSLTYKQQVISSN